MKTTNAMSPSPEESISLEQIGSSPVGRGGAGTYIEGELGAYYLLQMLAGSVARGLPDARIQQVQLQGENEGYALDDLIVHGVSDKGTAILEIQSKRTIRFSPRDPIFKSVCEQIVRSNPAENPTDRHLLAVATQRTSYSISGPYQDVLEWARRAQSGSQFFARLALKGVASEEMRSFAESFRNNLVAQGVTDEDEGVWAILRRFMILEFDFESAAPEAKAHALTLARQVLAPEDAKRAEALWSNLIEIVIERLNLASISHGKADEARFLPRRRTEFRARPCQIGGNVAPRTYGDRDHSGRRKSSPPRRAGRS